MYYPCKLQSTIISTPTLVVILPHTKDEIVVRPQTQFPKQPETFFSLLIHRRIHSTHLNKVPFPHHPGQMANIPPVHALIPISTAYTQLSTNYRLKISNDNLKWIGTLPEARGLHVEEEAVQNIFEEGPKQDSHEQHIRQPSHGHSVLQSDVNHSERDGAPHQGDDPPFRPRQVLQPRQALLSQYLHPVAHKSHFRPMFFY